MTTVTMPAPASRKTLEPWIPDTVEYYPWQVSGIRDGCRRRSYILGDDMGLGKTIQALTVFSVDVKLGKATTAIVVAPATLKGNWAEEIDKFTRFPYIVLGHEQDEHGRMKTLTPVKRVQQLVEFASIKGPKILVTNYEQIAAHLQALNALKFDIAIFDEAHLLAGHGTKRTKACHSPLLNHVNGLWSLLHLIDPGRWPKYWPFVNRYCVFGGYKEKQIVGVKNEAELKRIMSEVMIRREAIDCLPLDKPTIIQRHVDLHPRQRELYEQIVEDMKLTIPDEPTPVEIQNALTKFLKLKQICGTTATVLGQDEDYSHKLDLAIEDDMELIKQGEKIVVFTQFRGVQLAYLNRLMLALSKIGDHTPAFMLHGDVPVHARVPMVKAWESVKGPAVIICMLQVAGIGLNMTAACEGSFLDKLFVPLLNQQAIGRLNRIGQIRPVRIREYRVRGTIETRIEQILKTKNDVFKNVIASGDYKKLLYLAMTAAAEDE
jgi:SNF2 family DNA or RNA helicase